jgi:SNF2 family DNA or RNA helicase
MNAHVQNFRRILAYAKLEEKPHQIQGLQWCLENELRVGQKIRGGFIADEMGLGKTLTMIGAIFCNFKPATLIVLPVALIAQWRHEILRTTGHEAVIFHGKAKKEITREKLETSPIVLTSYNTICVNTTKSKDATLLHEVRWHRVIFDEAHHLRNHKTTRFVGAKMLDAKIRWLVSGTPVQNKKADFYALCNLLRLPASVYTDPEQIPIIYKHFILKRTKREVGIDLPNVVDQSSVVQWTNAVEEAFCGEFHSKLGFIESEKVVGGDDESFKTIQLLTKAKQSCTLPKLLFPRTLDEKEETCEMGMSKMDAVVDSILNRMDNGNGKLVFCHYKQEIDVLVKRLREGGVERVASLDGRDSALSRTAILSQKYDILVLQIQTGCEGLNLQQNYSEIFFVTPHWNPSVEDQAIGRCHRMGQTKPVSVFRFEMAPPLQKNDSCISFDNYVTYVQNKKREIVNEILP